MTDVRDLTELADKFYRAADEAVDIVLDANAKARAALKRSDPKTARDWALTSDRQSRVAAKMVERLAEMEGRAAGNLPQGVNIVAIFQEFERRGILKPGSVNPALIANGADARDAEAVSEDS